MLQVRVERLLGTKSAEHTQKGKTVYQLKLIGLLGLHLCYRGSEYYFSHHCSTSTIKNIEPARANK